MKTYFLYFIFLILFTLTSAQTFTPTKRYKKSVGIFNTLGIIKSDSTNSVGKEVYDLFYESLISAILRDPSLPKINIMNTAYNTLSKKDSVKISRKNYFSAYIPETENFCNDGYCPDGILIFKTFRIKAKNISSSTLHPLRRYTFLADYFILDNRRGEIAGYGTIEKKIDRNRDHDMRADYESMAFRFSDQIVSDMKFLRSKDFVTTRRD
ncbi:MAG: hypothetical protein PVI26_11005 [Chitinispirillia bacterium]|jgi:hypothetical protein